MDTPVASRATASSASIACPPSPRASSVDSALACTSHMSWPEAPAERMRWIATYTTIPNIAAVGAKPSGTSVIPLAAGAARVRPVRPAPYGPPPLRPQNARYCGAHPARLPRRSAALRSFPPPLPLPPPHSGAPARRRCGAAAAPRPTTHDAAACTTTCYDFLSYELARAETVSCAVRAWPFLCGCASKRTARPGGRAVTRSTSPVSRQ